ncbi:hypothetical protein B1P86_13990 [Enterococcus faecium]|nr:hypothetical protein B1P86_13990 [Enterococcus faecium]
MRDYFSIFFSNTQVNSLISQPLDKWCSKASFLNGVQKLASTILRTKFMIKNCRKAIFTKFFLILETKRLFHSLFI